MYPKLFRKYDSYCKFWMGKYFNCYVYRSFMPRFGKDFCLLFCGLRDAANWSNQSNGYTKLIIYLIYPKLQRTFNFKVERVGIIQNRVEAFQKIFDATIQSDFFSNEKLLVVGNTNLFISVLKIILPVSFGKTKMELQRLNTILLCFQRFRS